MSQMRIAVIAKRCSEPVKSILSAPSSLLRWTGGTRRNAVVRGTRLLRPVAADACASGGGSCLLAQALGSMARSKRQRVPLPDTYPLFRQWAAAVGGGRIGRVAGHSGEQIVVVPVAFAF